MHIFDSESTAVQHPLLCRPPAVVNAKSVAMLFIVLSQIGLLTVIAQDVSPPQVDVRVRAKATGLGTSFQRQIEGGAAMVFGRVHNLPGGETALVSLQFDYRSDAEIALDEIISRIVISIEDSSGNGFSTIMIDPNAIPLNPNRAPLWYSGTLYVPNEIRVRDGYTVHVEIFGNYE